MRRFRMTERSGLVAILSCALTGCALAFHHDAVAQSAPERARAFVAELNEPDAPGCALGVVQDGEWVFRGGFGLADLEQRVPNTSRTVFGVASVSKQFTAASIAIAGAQGFLSLDDDVGKYIPELPDYGRPITIRHLVHHTNGLRDDGHLVRLTGQAHRYTTQKDLVRLFARQHGTNFPAGDRYLYSNAAYVLLAEIIERATGKSLGEYAEEQIFRPLGMESTHYETRERAVEHRAVPYARDSVGWSVTGRINQARTGAGGLWTTIDEYATWATNLIADESKLTGGAGLTSLLRTPGLLNDGSSTGYGFGLGLGRYRGLELISHGGSGMGFKAHTMIFPSEALGVFGFCNNGVYAQPTVTALADLFLDAEPFSTATSKEERIRLSPPQLERLSGTYREASLAWPAFVSVADSTIVVNDASPPNLTSYEPLSATRFRGWADRMIEFIVDDSGKAVGFRQTVGDAFVRIGTGRFERIEPVEPSPAELDAYVGEYYSSELDALYRFTEEQGRLVVRMLGAPAADLRSSRPTPPEPIGLMPMLQDEFVSLPERIVFRFERHGAGDVTGFTVSAQFGWVTEVRFERSSATTSRSVRPNRSDPDS